MKVVPPDGRKKAVGIIIMPYYANCLDLGDEQVVEICRRFIENSCRNFGRCDKIYDSWLRSMLRTVTKYKYKVISKQKLMEVIPEVYEVLQYNHVS